MVLQLNLQRFAGEKTERATPQRRREVRREGRIPRSAELTSTVTLLAVILGLRIYGGRIWSGWQTLMSTDFAHAQTTDLTQQQVSYLMTTQTWDVLKLVLPLLVMGFLAAAITGFAQVGAVFLPNQIVPDFKRVNPFSGMRRLVSTRSLVEALKSMLKLVLVGVVAYSVVRGAVHTVAELMNVDVASYPRIVGGLVFRMIIEIVALMLVLAAFDYAYQRYDFEKSIRMSIEEIKEEHKRTEGDPVVRGQIRKRGYAISRSRMMKAVETADVVVTNPTHFAVALVYDLNRASAPIVVAKGQDELALKIRQRAEEFEVPVVENRPLARALYDQVEIDTVIPEDLYKAVAEVLAYVFSLKKR